MLFSAQKMQSLLANRFYYWEAEPEAYKPENRKKTSCACQPPETINRHARWRPELANMPNNNENVEIPIPHNLEWY